MLGRDDASLGIGDGGPREAGLRIVLPLESAPRQPIETEPTAPYQWLNFVLSTAKCSAGRPGSRTVASDYPRRTLTRQTPRISRANRASITARAHAVLTRHTQRISTQTRNQIEYPES
jgi:hypothetical protein